MLSLGFISENREWISVDILTALGIRNRPSYSFLAASKLFVRIVLRIMIPDQWMSMPQMHRQMTKRHYHSVSRCWLWLNVFLSTSVAEWIGSRTFNQQVVGSNLGRRVAECNPGQVVYTRASVTRQYNLVPANGRWCPVAGEVTACLAESNRSLRPGLWLRSPAGWLPRTGISSGTLRSFPVWEYLYLGRSLLGRPNRQLGARRLEHHSVVHIVI